MDKLLRDTVLAGFSEKQIAEVVGLELKRRGMIGVLYFFPNTGGNGTYVACAPSDLIEPEMPVSEQLALFAALATRCVKETSITPEDLDKQWLQ